MDWREHLDPSSSSSRSHLSSLWLFEIFKRCDLLLQLIPDGAPAEAFTHAFTVLTAFPPSFPDPPPPARSLSHAPPSPYTKFLGCRGQIVSPQYQHVGPPQYRM